MLGQTYARFRLSRDGGLGPTGFGGDGEVEDYLITITSLNRNVNSIVTEAGNTSNSVTLPTQADRNGDGAVDLLDLAHLQSTGSDRGSLLTLTRFLGQSGFSADSADSSISAPAQAAALVVGIPGGENPPTARRLTDRPASRRRSPGAGQAKVSANVRAGGGSIEPVGANTNRNDGFRRLTAMRRLSTHLDRAIVDWDAVDK